MPYLVRQALQFLLDAPQLAVALLLPFQACLLSTEVVRVGGEERRELDHVALEVLHLGGVVLLRLGDHLESLGVSRGLEYVVKLLLQHRALGQRPAALLLVAEDHVLHYRPGDAQQVGDVLVQLAALVAQTDRLSRVALHADHSLQSLVLELRLPPQHLQGANHHGVLAALVPEAELDAGLDLGGLRDGRVVDERVAVLRVGRQRACAAVLERLDDTGFPAAVGANDHGQRRVELGRLARRKGEVSLPPWSPRGPG